MYSLLRSILFQLDTEFTHRLSLQAIDVLSSAKLLKPFLPAIESRPVTVMGLEFPNPVGLAAGLDKDGDHFNGLGDIGFGFIEIGTVTPKPQLGNPQPRLFRLPEYQAIINRMGFNNKGVDHLVEQVKNRRYQGVLGINIGKNASTPVENAVDDYRIGLQKVYGFADYIAVNISSPNTPGLRTLQYGDQLRELLAAIKSEQLSLEGMHDRYVPIAIKIAPDIDENEVKQVAASLVESGMDCVIATNTTLNREAVAGHKYEKEAGGLSGAPVTQPSLAVIQQLSAELGSKMPIIGVGGIMNGSDAADKIKAGASLVQVYSGFIYRGPSLISESVKAIYKL